MSQLVVRKGDEGDAFWMLGGLYEVKVSSEETGGAMTVMQMTLPAGMGPPPHTHPGTETVIVLDGALDYYIGDELLHGTKGATFHIPAGTVERFDPTEDTVVLVIYSPGGIEQFFAEAGEHALTRVVPPAPTEAPDIERLAAIASRYGMEIQAPPES